MSDITKDLGKQIRVVRVQSGLTLKEAGERVGVGEATFSRYETGKQNLTIETIKKVADALGVEFKFSFNKL